MQVINGVGQLDFDAQADNEVVLAINDDGLYVRLWKRRGELIISVPLTEELLSDAERDAIQQHQTE